MQRVVEQLSVEDIKRILQNKVHSETSFEQRYEDIKQVLERDGTDACWQSSLTEYESIFKYYDMDDGLLRRGGFMRTSPMKLLKFHVPNFKFRFKIIKKIIEYNLWGYMGHTTKNNKSIPDSVEGGTNTPISIQCQIMLAILLCNLFHEYHPYFKGIIMVLILI